MVKRVTCMYIKRAFANIRQVIALVGIIFLGSISKDFTKNELSEISFNGTVYDFSVEDNSIKKEDIVNIHQCLKIKNNVK